MGDVNLQPLPGLRGVQELVLAADDGQHGDGQTLQGVVTEYGQFVHTRLEVFENQRDELQELSNCGRQIGGRPRKNNFAVNLAADTPWTEQGEALDTIGPPGGIVQSQPTAERDAND